MSTRRQNECRSLCIRSHLMVSVNEQFRNIDLLQCVSVGVYMHGGTMKLEADLPYTPCSVQEVFARIQTSICRTCRVHRPKYVVTRG